ncbi:Bax inhibitor-1/YccA family protein [Tessaracoccus caeni]|uniref:Bax inhibitor-1/YccA family protein n=1 Tax=Tessaracoccus caeni TaxID=3031239 RepID=UPI0023D9F1A9|nr:Bax inhibitor-1/YccA family protein [Tessaracoccus caeni]MDF1489150.1 Bax inhibitor-1/YccA family protein [Tessaracoccus caeni]
MANPIIGRPDAFAHGGAQQQGHLQQGYGPDPYLQQQMPQPGGVMTLDDVIAKSAITLGTVFAAAIATWMLLPMQFLYPAWIGSAIAGLVVVFVVARRPNISAGGVLLYALVEGVFVGAISKFFQVLYPGIVVQAVLATFVTAAVTLAAYKFFNLRVTPKFRKMVTIGTIAFAGVMIVNFVVSLISGSNTALREIGPQAGWISIAVSLLAVALAVMNLVVDFDSIEQGIAMRAPASESWRGALGITVTLVWLYVEMLRILSYFRGD